MSILDIILTEKTVKLAQAGKFTFKVSKSANREEIAQEVARHYNVHVVKVHVANLPAKVKGRGKYLGKRPGFKKAIVTLRPGEKIEDFIIETGEKEKKEEKKLTAKSVKKKEEKVKKEKKKD